MRTCLVNIDWNFERRDFVSLSRDRRRTAVDGRVISTL